MAPPPSSSTPSAPPPPVEESDETRELRRRLVREIESRGGPWDGERWDARVLDVMREVPRHVFAPEVGLVAAYRDMPQPIGHGQTISQPTVVAIMTQALELEGEEKVLEIGTGSGYQAAILGRLAKRVFSIEIKEPLAASAKEKLAKLGFENVEVRAGDGYKGWPEQAPFDRIIVTAAPDTLPRALVEQLAAGGVMVAPVGPEGGTQRLLRYRKKAGKLLEEDLGAVLFVPMVRGD